MAAVPLTVSAPEEGAVESAVTSKVPLPDTPPALLVAVTFWEPFVVAVPV